MIVIVAVASPSSSSILTSSFKNKRDDCLTISERLANPLSSIAGRRYFTPFSKQACAWSVGRTDFGAELLNNTQANIDIKESI
jgi:hypothetical protein